MRTLSICLGAAFVAALASGARADEPADAAAPALPAAPHPADETPAPAPKEKGPTAIPPAPAPLATEDGWTFFTNGRLSNFVSYSRGEGMPQSTTYDVETGMPKHQVLTNTGGTGLSPQSSVPATKMDGTPASMALVSTIDSWRMRSGFLGNQFIFGARRKLGESLVTGLSALKDFARELRGKPGTAIRIGIHSGLVQGMVPRIVRAVSRSGVKIRPDLVTATARRIHRLLHQRRLDIGLVIEGDAKDVPDKLIWDQLGSSEVALLVPSAHPLAKRREPLQLAEVCGLPLIVNEPRLGYGRALLGAFADRDLTPDIVADCDDLESLKAMIAAGGGVGLMPRIAAEREIARGVLFAVPLDPPQSVSIQLLRSQDMLPPRLERFRGQFVKEIAEARWPTQAAKGAAPPQRGAVPA